MYGTLNLNRRTFLTAAAAGPVSALAPALCLAGQGDQYGGDPESMQGFWEMPRWVWLKRAATGKEIRRVYWRDGQLIPGAYEELSWFLRDLRFERMLEDKDRRIGQALDRGLITREHLSPWMLMDPVLLDILYAHTAWLRFYGINEPLLLTSALRHILTNALTEGAARDSWHTKGGAADIVIPGISPIRVASFSRWLAGGGVGLYVTKNFVHVDRGRVRTWRG